MDKQPLFSLSPMEAIEPLKDVYFPPYITLAHIFHAPEPWRIRSRVLKQYQLQYALNGGADYRIGDTVYETSRGDLLFHRPGEAHSVSTRPGRGYTCISVVFHFGQSGFPLHELLRNRHRMGNFAGEELERKLSQLVVHYKQQGAYHQYRAQTLLSDVLLDLARRIADQAVSGASRTQRNNYSRMVLLRNTIAERYMDNLQIHDLERIAGLSRDYLIEQFKRTFGMTPIQYLLHVRVEKAKELALQGHLSVGEIALQIGYADVHTFGRMFKKKTGYSLSSFCASLFTRGDYKEDDNSLPSF